MKIEVLVKESELNEMGITREELKQSIIADLNNSDIDGEYVGFDVLVRVEVGV